MGSHSFTEETVSSTKRTKTRLYQKKKRSFTAGARQTLMRIGLIELLIE